MHWDYILLLVLLAVLVPWRSMSRVQELAAGPDLGSSQRLMLYFSTIVFQCTAVCIIVWRCLAHHLSWVALGVALPHLFRTVAASVGLSAILVVNQVYAIRRTGTLPYERRGIVAKLAERLLPRTRREALFGILLVLTVAICEEFIYRGFVQALFTGFSAGSAFAGALISAIFFSSAHTYQGRKGLLTTFIVGLLFSGVRIWTGSLLAPIIIHFAIDFSVGVAAFRFLPPRTDPLALFLLYFPNFACPTRMESRLSKVAR